MTAGQLSRHAGRAQLGVIERADVRQAADRRRIERRRCHRRHIRGQLSLLEPRHPLEEGARNLVELRRELVRAQAAEGGGEAVDRIVLGGQRAVPAGIVHLELERHVHFFARLHRSHQALAVQDHRIAGVHVEHVRRIDQIAMMAEQPFDAVVIAAAFFARRQREDQVAVGAISLLLESQERGDQNGRPILDVLRAAAVEVAVLLHEGERIHRPVFALRLDDVEMREQEDRLFPTRPAKPRDKIAVLRTFETDDLHVRRWKPRIAESLGHRVGGDGGAAARASGVDVDELLEDVARALIVRRQ